MKDSDTIVWSAPHVAVSSGTGPAPEPKNVAMTPSTALAATVVGPKAEFATADDPSATLVSKALNARTSATLSGLSALGLCSCIARARGTGGRHWPRARGAKRRSVHVENSEAQRREALLLLLTRRRQVHGIAGDAREDGTTE